MNGRLILLLTLDAKVEEAMAEALLEHGRFVARANGAAGSIKRDGDLLVAGSRP